MALSDRDPTHVVVIVTRTGGFAGLRRAWRAEPPPEEAPVLVRLVQQCPWNWPAEEQAEPEPETGDSPARLTTGTMRPQADRFVWSIQAWFDEEDEREARLPDTEVTGAWRDLVDAVREWNDLSEKG